MKRHLLKFLVLFVSFNFSNLSLAADIGEKPDGVMILTEKQAYDYTKSICSNLTGPSARSEFYRMWSRGAMASVGINYDEVAYGARGPQIEQSSTFFISPFLKNLLENSGFFKANYECFGSVDNFMHKAFVAELILADRAGQLTSWFSLGVPARYLFKGLMSIQAIKTFDQTYRFVIPILLISPPFILAGMKFREMMIFKAQQRDREKHPEKVGQDLVVGAVTDKFNQAVAHIEFDQEKIQTAQNDLKTQNLTPAQRKQYEDDIVHTKTDIDHWKGVLKILEEKYGADLNALLEQYQKQFKN